MAAPSNYPAVQWVSRSERFDNVLESPLKTGYQEQRCYSVSYNIEYLDVQVSKNHLVAQCRSWGSLFLVDG